MSSDKTVPQACVSAAIFSKGRVLLVKRAKAPMAGLWSFPGGHILPGENAHHAVCRELYEETGIIAGLHGICGVRDVIQRNDRDEVLSHHVIVVFYGSWHSGNIQAGSDAGDVCWHDIDQLDQLALTDGLAELAGQGRLMLDREQGETAYPQTEHISLQGEVPNYESCD